MAPPEVIVIPTGTANIASMLAGLRRAGAAPRLSADPAAVRDAPRVVLPGVGAFGAALVQLQEIDALVPLLAARVRAGRATLGVCLGMQLLCEGSEESPGVRGLAVVPARVERFPDTVRVPQLGWNQVTPSAECRLLQAGHAYFANSYRVAQPPAGWAAARSDHGGPFVAALERGAVLLCQFHPELSGPWGTDLLRRWLDAAEGA